MNLADNAHQERIKKHGIRVACNLDRLEAMARQARPKEEKQAKHTLCNPRQRGLRDAFDVIADAPHSLEEIEILLLEKGIRDPGRSKLLTQLATGVRLGLFDRQELSNGFVYSLGEVGRNISGDRKFRAALTELWFNEAEIARRRRLNIFVNHSSNS